jgi:pSer/pThr/pTyr-binding forkhead associated (FHA) protein
MRGNTDSCLFDSTNGTFVNGVIVGKNECRQLRDGEIISIASPKPYPSNKQKFKGIRHVIIIGNDVIRRSRDDCIHIHYSKKR